MKPGKHQRFQDLCFKVHDRGAIFSFALIHYARNENGSNG